MYFEVAYKTLDGETKTLVIKSHYDAKFDQRSVDVVEEQVRELLPDCKILHTHTIGEKICSICNEKLEEYGHNAEPVNSDRCCTSCNSNVVIPERLKALRS